MRALRPLLAVAGTCAALLAGEATAVPAPSAGHLAIITASLLGGDGDETVTALAVQSDRTVVAAGTCAGAFPVPGLAAPAAGDAKGFVLRLDPFGKPRSIAYLPQAVSALALGPQDSLVLRDEAGAVTILDAEGRKRLGGFTAPHANAPTLAVDGDGSIIIGSGSSLRRYGADGRLAWEATPPAHGGNRLRACAVDPATGISVAVGYGMTHTGREPYKAPYAHGFDRTGKRIWSLWNPDPKDQKGSEHGGTGLMADGTGDGAVATPDGRFLVRVFHDGGNAVTTRDPSDPRQKIDPAVFAGSYQGGPGHGMKGAITTSVIFRVDPASGRLEKGTWMCAWMNGRSRANSLSMHGAAADAQGDVYVVGGSAWELTTMQPWQEFRDGEYRGGAFLAAFDSGFAMRQCGAFNPADLHAVAARDGVVVVAGRAKGHDKQGKPIADGLRFRTERPLAHDRVKGAGDAAIIILHRRDTAIAAAPAPAPAAAPAARSTSKPSRPRPLTADPGWDAAFAERLQAAIAAGRTIDLDAFGERRQIIACADGTISLRQGDGGMQVALRILDVGQRVAVARQLARMGDGMDHLLAAYYLRLSGDDRSAQIHLAHAGRTAEALDQPPQGIR